MTERLEIITSYVLPGGVCLKQFADGHLPVRCGLGWVHAPEGIIAELDGTMAGEAIPWESKAIRDEAIGQLERWPGMPEVLRARLIAYVRKSAYYQRERT